MPRHSTRTRSADRERRAPVVSAALGALCGALLAVLWSLPASGVAADRATATYESPVEPFVAANLFDRPPLPWLAGHRGIDVAAQVGQAVRAPAAGVVTYAGVVVDRGVVTVLHDDGLRSSLEPVAAAVTAGARVERGEVVGVVTDQHSHCGALTCVHWGVRRGERYVNPLDVLAGFGRIRLLPLGEHRYANAPVFSSSTRRRFTAAE